MQDSNVKKTPLTSGIDTLYYFAQSGGFYDEFYVSLMDAIEDKKAYFLSLNYTYHDNDIIVPINGIDVVYSGMGRDGFHWFAHEFFRAGFKDSEKSQNMHNIRIQLNAIGIYTLGIKSLIEYINTKFLEKLTMGYFPVTRIDLNTFVQHDFYYLRKEMILSKKKNHSANIGERSSGYRLETYYVGKKPFLLRIYDKHMELNGASQIKRELMHNHFGINGLDIEKPIFNVEFEMHREFLKQYGIDTIEDAISRSEVLFKSACDLVRLIDPDSISEKQHKNGNRKRAKTLSIWQEIKDSYSIKEFMQIDTPLEKIEKITYRYSLEDGEKSIKRVLMRLLMHSNRPTWLYLIDILESVKEDYDIKQSMKSLHKEEKVVRSFEEDLKHYSIEGLDILDEKLSKEMQSIPIKSPYYNELLHKYDQLYNEFVRRNLRPDF